jgi:hypothetical protein
MELTETIESLNRQLIDLYGVDTLTGQAMWRIVWSEDQYEMIHGTFSDFTEGGLYIRTVTETRKVKKYLNFTTDRYILERLVLVPEINANELVASKLSYEPLWTFENGKGEYLPPKLNACKFIADTVLATQHGDHSLKRYVDPEGTHEGALEGKKKRVDNIIEELFGDQSSLDYTTVTGESIIVPRNYEKSERENKS